MRMRTSSVVGLVLGLACLGLAVSTAAADPAALAKAAGCMKCHAVDKKIMGPSYQDVAAKYRGDKGAAKRLASAVRDGSKGVWGKVPMMPMLPEQISDADLATVIQWVLSQK